VDFIIDDVSERYGFPQLRPFLERRLEEGSVLLLLDGLDEVTVGSQEEAETVYHHTANEINRLVTRYPKCPIVVTSRRAGWKGLLVPAFRIMTVLDFAWEDIQNFINNWFGEGSDKARNLQIKLSQRADMQSLAANPLLLSLIAIAYERDLELPERRARLYERCVEVLLTEWDAHRGVKRASRFTTDRKRDLLEDIALHFHSLGVRYFPKDELLEVIAHYLPSVNILSEEAPLVLEEISAQHALLKEQAAEWYGFLHLTLQEYFAAVSLDKGNQLDLALAHLHNPWWEEVLLLLAGMLKDATPLLDAILLGQDDIFYRDLLLAGRCLAGTPRIRRFGLRQEICDRLKALIENRQIHWLPRSQAVRVLGEAGSEGAKAYLLDLLGDPNVHWRIGVAAAETLGARADRFVGPRLLALLPNEQISPNVREWIADALGNLGDAAIAPQLRALLSNQGISSQVQARIARVLAKLGDKAAIPLLLGMLSDDSLDGHRGWGFARALAYLKFTTDPKELRRHLRDQKLNLAARWALAKAVDNLDGSAAPEIVAWISDESIDRGIRCTFAYRLGRFGKAIQDKLRSLYSDESLDLSVRASIGITLLDLGETERVTDLKELLVNPDVYYYTRKKIAETLIRFGERDIAEQFMTLLREKDLPASVRLRMTDLLASLGDSAVVPELLDFLQDEHVDAPIRARAADALSTLNLRSFLSDVKDLVMDEEVDSLVRGRATHGLIQDENGIAWLTGLLQREDIAEEAFLALYDACQQAGVRVFAESNGDYHIQPTETTPAR